MFLFNDDCLKVLPTLPENSIDTCISDPPYHLTQASRGGSPRKNNPETPFGRHHIGEAGFMGQTWDGGGIAFDPATWKAVYRVLKPGASLLVFGAPRTWHRLACAIEDAGFEMQDCMMHLQAQGMAKGHNIAKAMRAKGLKEADTWEGWNVALAPKYEPIVLAQKPRDGTYVENAIKWKVAGLWIDGARLRSGKDKAAGGAQKLWSHYRNGKEPTRVGEPSAEQRYTDRGATNLAAKPGPRGGDPKGRWPSNVLLEHSEDCRLIGYVDDEGYVINRFKDGAKPFGGGAGHKYETEKVDGGKREVWGCPPYCPIRKLDDQAGIRKSGGPGPDGHKRNKPGNKEGIYGGGKRLWKEAGPAGHLYADKGGASRFFFCSKASRSEREEGLLGYLPCTTCGKLDSTHHTKVVEGKEKKVACRRNRHSTVKPVALMEYLCRLTSTPTGGSVIDPFMGSGTTGVACARTGRVFFGIEKDTEQGYFKIAQLRIQHAVKQVQELPKPKKKTKRKAKKKKKRKAKK